MRILLITSEYGKELGGLALHCFQLKEIFEEIGHSVLVADLSTVENLFSVSGGYDPELNKKLNDAYRLRMIVEKYSGKADICISCGAGITSYYAMLFCRIERIRLIVVSCGSDLNLAITSAEQMFYNLESIKYADIIVSASKGLIDNARVINDNLDTKYYVIPNYCDMNTDKGAVDRRNTIKSDERIVFASGSTFLNEKKGISNLIKVFGELKNIHKRDDVLYLYGKIDEDVRNQYNKLITDNSLEKNIKLCGYLSRDEYLRSIKEVDVYIQASPFEGFSNSAVEAINLGVDILTTDTGYVAENIRDVFPGHIITSLEKQKMVECILHYCRDIYPLEEAASIRRYLAPDLNKKNVISSWKTVFSTGKIDFKRLDNSTLNTVMFHDVGESYSGIDYAKAGFRELVQKVYDCGYKLCSSREYFSCEQKDNKIVCTFDDGYENVYLNAFPILCEYGFNATVFVCPDLIGKDNSWNHKDEVNRNHMTDEMLRELADSEWEIGSHGMSHMNHIRLSEHELEESLLKSKQMLMSYGIIDCFCYPYGAFNDFIRNRVKKYYLRAFSVSVGGTDYLNDTYQLTRFTPEELYKRLEA